MLTADIPDGERDVLVRHILDVEANGWYGRYHLAKFEFYRWQNEYVWPRYEKIGSL